MLNFHLPHYDSFKIDIEVNFVPGQWIKITKTKDSQNWESLANQKEVQLHNFEVIPLYHIPHHP